MKIKIFVLVMLLAGMLLAQTSSPAKPGPDQPQASAATQANCPCCDKMMDGKSAESCCAQHHDQTAKSEMSCCQGKDGKEAMSCAKSQDCCSGEKACGKDHKDCCDHSGKTSEQAKMSCCSGGQCGMSHHGQGDVSK
jgi:hypothetical protein